MLLALSAAAPALAFCRLAEVAQCIVQQVPPHSAARQLLRLEKMQQHGWQQHAQVRRRPMRACKKHNTNARRTLCMRTGYWRGACAVPQHTICRRSTHAGAAPLLHIPACLQTSSSRSMQGTEKVLVRPGSSSTRCRASIDVGCTSPHACCAWLGHACAWARLLASAAAAAPAPAAAAAHAAPAPARAGAAAAAAAA